MENIDPESTQNEIIEKIKLKPKKSILKKSESEIEHKLSLKQQGNHQSDNENNENPKKLKLSTDGKTENHSDLEDWTNEDQSKEEDNVEDARTKPTHDDSETEWSSNDASH